MMIFTDHREGKEEVHRILKGRLLTVDQGLHHLVGALPTRAPPLNLPSCVPRYLERVAATVELALRETGAKQVGVCAVQGGLEI